MNKITILGCGSSLGVPAPNGFMGICDKNEPKNYRSRCSIILQTKKLNILIDTSPDLRSQLIKNKIKKIDKVFYTHQHADQTHGINDLRVFYINTKKKIPVYADRVTSNYLRSNFQYCFKKKFGYPPILSLNKLKEKHVFNVGNDKINIKSVTVRHGKIDCMSFIFNNKCAYASDVNLIYKRDLKKFINLNFLIIDCLRYREHPTHFNLAQVLKLIKLLKPKKTILTNLHSDIDYEIIKKELPKNVVPAFDGMSILF